MNIILVAGHNSELNKPTFIGGRKYRPHKSDSGTTGERKGRAVEEHQEALKIVEGVAKKLKKFGVPRFVLGDYTPKVTVLDDRLNLLQKIDFINNTAKKEDMLISVHFNAYKNDTANGTETYYNALSVNFPPHRSLEIAKRVQETLYKRLGTKSRGHKPDTASAPRRLAILRDTVPQNDCLVEMGFLRNGEDMDKIDKNGIESLWLAICDGYKKAISLQLR